MVQSPGHEPPASGFKPCPLTVASRLLSPHRTEGKTHRLMVKQLSTVRSTQRDSQSYMEKRRGRWEIEVIRREKGESKEKREIKPVINP